MTRPARLCVVALAGIALLLAGCTPAGSAAERVEPATNPVYPEVRTYPDIPVIADLPYGDIDGQQLDVCLPDEPDDGTDDEAARPAIIVIHGGSWQRGDKSNINWRSVCQWFASEGFVSVSVNYRLAPVTTFPAQLQDMQTVVRWLRDPAQISNYDIDPDRIGAFGGSAGGNLAALLGTAGSGSWTEDARVAAVADFSGPVDLRTAIPTVDSYSQDFGTVVLEYLGCTDFDDCPASAQASPVTLVDESDPPFFVAHSTEEFIPLSQSESLVATLRGNGIPTTFVTVEGTLHSIAMLDDDMRDRVLAFFRYALR